MGFVCGFPTWYYSIRRKKWEWFFGFVVAKILAIGFDFVGGIDLRSWLSRCWSLLRSGENLYIDIYQQRNFQKDKEINTSWILLDIIHRFVRQFDSLFNKIIFNYFKMNFLLCRLSLSWNIQSWQHGLCFCLGPKFSESEQ